MTRLNASDIGDIKENLASYDTRLKAMTGASLWGIGCRTAGIGEDEARSVLESLDIAAIPMTCGLGVIGGFAESVAAIVSHAGGNGFVTEETDAAGLAEAFERKARILMLADDRRFVAIHPESRKVADNGLLTGAAYAVGLDLMSGGVADHRVLVIGCGPVGAGAAETLARIGARVAVCDISPEPARALKARLDRIEKSRVLIADSLEDALATHRLIVDASPAAGIITAKHITDETYVSAPGMPCGLAESARNKIAGRLLHDPLELGVTAMLAATIKHHIEFIRNVDPSSPTP